MDEEDDDNSDLEDELELGGQPEGVDPASGASVKVNKSVRMAVGEAEGRLREGDDEPACGCDPACTYRKQWPLNAAGKHLGCHCRGDSLARQCVSNSWDGLTLECS